MINDNFDYKYSEIGNIPIFNLATLMFKFVFLYIIRFFPLNIFFFFFHLFIIVGG